MMCDGISLRANCSQRMADFWIFIAITTTMFGTRPCATFWRCLFNDRLNSPRQEKNNTRQSATSRDYFRAGGPDFRFLDRELTDMFTSEGYLAMLLGQGVAFNAPAEPLETERWKQFKIDLQRQASAGMDAPGRRLYLRMNADEIRWFNPVYTTPGPGSAIV